MYDDPKGRQLTVDDCIALATGTCPDCQDPASCQAGAECLLHQEQLLQSVYPAFDRIR
jgi:hypothetical protein